MQARRYFFLLVLTLGLCATANGAGEARPLDKAKAGEWLLQKGVASGYTSWTYLWIAKVDGRKVTVMTQLLKDEKLGLAPGQATVVDLDKSDPAPRDAAKTKTSEEVIEVKGKKLTCTRTETEVEVQGLGKMVSTTWTSPEIPIYGIAKMVAKDKDQKVVAEQETIDWGREGGGERPLK